MLAAAKPDHFAGPLFPAHSISTGECNAFVGLAATQVHVRNFQGCPFTVDGETALRHTQFVALGAFS